MDYTDKAIKWLDEEIEKLEKTKKKSIETKPETTTRVGRIRKRTVYRQNKKIPEKGINEN